MRIGIRRGCGDLEKFKEKYGLVALDEIKISRLSAFKRKVVRDVSQNIVGWIIEIRASRRSGKAESVIIEGVNGRAIKVNPSNIVLVGNKLFLVDNNSKSIALLEKLLKDSDTDITGEAGKKVRDIDHLLLKRYITEDEKSTCLELMNKQYKKTDVVKLIEMVEERTKEELEDILMKWFLGEVHLDDFLDTIEKLNTMLEKLNSIKRALSGDIQLAVEDVS